MAQPDFNQVCSDFKQFRAIIEQALAGPGDAAVKQQLQALAGNLDKTFVELQDAYPQAQAALNEKRAGMQKSAAETEAKLAGLKEQIAAAEAQAAAAVEMVPSAAPPDPDLGQRLRAELLERFGPHAQPQTPPSTADREIWEDWNWQDWSNN